MKRAEVARLKEQEVERREAERAAAVLEKARKAEETAAAATKGIEDAARARAEKEDAAAAAAAAKRDEAAAARQKELDQRQRAADEDQVRTYFDDGPSQMFALASVGIARRRPPRPKFYGWTARWLWRSCI